MNLAIAAINVVVALLCVLVAIANSRVPSQRKLVKLNVITALVFLFAAGGQIYAHRLNVDTARLRADTARLNAERP